MNRAYTAWLEKQLAQTERRIDSSRLALGEDPRAPYRLQEALLLRRALEDARDYGRINEVYNGRCDQVMEMLSRELDRGQITAALYRSVERALRWEGRR